MNRESAERVATLPGSGDWLQGKTVDQNRSWHTTLRTPDTKIRAPIPDLNPHHVVIPVPSIRPSKLSAKITKHIASLGNCKIRRLDGSWFLLLRRHRRKTAKQTRP